MHFPGEQQYWYDHWTHERLEKSGSHNVAAPYEKVDRFAFKSKQETLKKRLQSLPQGASVPEGREYCSQEGEDQAKLSADA